MMTKNLRSPSRWAKGTSRTGALRIAALAGAALILSGCAAWPRAGNNGLFYTSTTTPFAVLDAEATSVRTGQACSVGLLGLFVTGNTSISAAMTSAGISKITTIEEGFTHYLFGAYTSYCTIVKGT